MQRTPYALRLIKSITYKSNSVFGRQGPEVRTETSVAGRQTPKAPFRVRAAGPNQSSHPDQFF